MQIIKNLISIEISLFATQITHLEDLSLRLAVNRDKLIRRAVDQFLDACEPTSSPANKAQRIKSIVGIWADRAETINPVDFVKKQRTSRF